jgi:hypothetical protein
MNGWQLERMALDLFDRMVGESWRTTLVGVATGLSVAIPSIIALLDGNPDTTANFAALATAVGAMIGGRVAADSNATFRGK